MYYFCKKCQSLSEQDICANCGGKNLKSPDDNDYCFLTEVDSMFGEMFGGMLKDENIPYAAYPIGNGVRTAFGLRLENLQIFTPFKFFLKAKELLNGILNNFEDEIRGNLINNADKLHVAIGCENKIKKKLKLPAEESLVDYVIENIMNADKIVDEGRITGCAKGGKYLFVYKNDGIFIINSATYEIISAKKQNKR